MEKKITITPEQMTRAIHEALSGKRMEPLMKKAPILSLAFSVFGAELIRILFNIKENTND